MDGGDCLSITDLNSNYGSERINLQYKPFVRKITEEGNIEMLPVIASSDPANPGLSVCVYGAASGYCCGTLTENTGEVGGSREVDLGTNGLLSEDIGAPVYTETKVGDRNLAHALGHVVRINNNDPQHQSFYYTPIEQAL